MSISFQCEQCKKKVKAPDDAGGKWGSCPFCKHRCYIPLPPSPDDEELKLAPVDDREETRYGKLMRETYSLTRNILQETAADGEPAAGGEFNEADEKKLIKNIIIYLRHMADGQLTQAEKTLTELSPHKNAANRILQKMLRAERPEPELADINGKVLQGLIKNLAAKMG